MPLTGYELFTNEVAVESQTDGHGIVRFTSGDRGLDLRMSRATGTQLLAGLMAWLGEADESEVVPLLPEE